MQTDGRTLLPVAFRGELFSEYEHETLEALITRGRRRHHGLGSRASHLAAHAGRASW